MSHYFIDDQNLEHNVLKKTFKINHESMDFYTDRGVFSKDKLDYGTSVLINHVDVGDAKTIIDIGCGYGPIGVYLAKTHQDVKVTMIDVNPRACALAKKNIDLHQIANAQVIESYLFEHVGQKADLMITNPPIRAGKQVVFKLYDEAYAHLNKMGRLYVVIQKKQGAPSSVKKLEALFGGCEVIAKDKGYWILLAVKF